MPRRPVFGAEPEGEATMCAVPQSQRHPVQPRPYPRISLVLVALASVGLLGCRPDTVELGFEPEPGATYRYRYDIEATVTRHVEGEQPRTTEVEVSFDSEQIVVKAVEGGTLVDITLTSDDGAARTVSVVVDRAGSLEAFQQVEGLPADAFGLPTGALLAAAATEPPRRPLSIGSTWEIAEGLVTGDGRLDRLGVLDGEPAAVTETRIVEVLTETTQRDGSSVLLDGDLISDTTTAFDLGDGSVRRSRTDSHGTVDVLVSPPVGVLAPAVEAIVTYELQVTTTRL